MAYFSRSFRSLLLIFCAGFVPFFAPIVWVNAQTLARPGWVGSGLTAQTWWKHAVLYEIDVRSFRDSTSSGAEKSSGLKEIAQHLDYLHSLGVDAILLTPVGVSGTASGAANPVDPEAGTLDDFDDLSLQASRRDIRILLELPRPNPALARFWLSRGVAGFYIPGLEGPGLEGSGLEGSVLGSSGTSSPGTSSSGTGSSGTGGSGTTSANGDTMQAIRKLLPSYVGQRVLITDAASSAAFVKSSGNELLFDGDLLKLPSAPPPNAAAQLRAALEQSQVLLRAAIPVIATDGPALPRSLNRFGGLAAPAGTTPGHNAQQDGMAKVLATALLLNRSGALLFSGQELGLSSPTGAAVPIPWGQPPAPVEDENAKPVAPVSRPPSDVYLPYNPHKTAAAPASRPVPPDSATAAGQDGNPRSLLNFYRQLSRLHRGNTVLKDGEEVVLNHDDQNALVWVRKPPAASLQRPAIVVACNLSNKPVVLSLRADMARLHLRGSFLRTVVRSDDLLGSMPLDAVTLPPFGVYVGELRY